MEREESERGNNIYSTLIHQHRGLQQLLTKHEFEYLPDEPRHHNEDTKVLNECELEQLRGHGEVSEKEKRRGIGVWGLVNNNYQARFNKETKRRHNNIDK